jgi:hypothetical protein
MDEKVRNRGGREPGIGQTLVSLPLGSDDATGHQEGSLAGEDRAAAKRQISRSEMANKSHSGETNLKIVILASGR